MVRRLPVIWCQSITGHQFDQAKKCNSSAEKRTYGVQYQHGCCNSDQPVSRKPCPTLRGCLFFPTVTLISANPRLRCFQKANSQASLTCRLNPVYPSSFSSFHAKQWKTFKLNLFSVLWRQYLNVLVSSPAFHLTYTRVLRDYFLIFFTKQV